MKRIKKMAVMLVVLVATNFSLLAEEEMNILFIGNSFTARHNLSELVKKVIEEGKPGLTVNVEAKIYGGQSLFQHTEYYFTQTFIEQNTISDSTVEARIGTMKELLELDEVPPEYIHFWKEIRGAQTVRDFPKNLIERAINRHESVLNSNPRIKWDFVVLQSWRDEVEDMNDPDGGPATIVFQDEEKIFLQQIAYSAVRRFVELWKAIQEVKPTEKGIDLLSSEQYITERPPWAGVWFNLSNDPHDVIAMGVDFAGISGRETWSKLEPQKGVYDLSSIKKNLEAAAETDSYWYFVLWTGPHSPDWIYENGVPEVRTDRDKFPYYLDEDYQNYIVAFFDTLAASIAGYGPDIAQRLAFIQPGFGSTGDRQLYKGTPEDSQYDISKEEYVNFMKKMTIAFTFAFERHESTTDVMFLWNIDDYNGSDPGQLEGNPEWKQGEMIYGAWMKQNYNCQLRKQQFTTAIGYMCPNEMDQDNEQRDNFFGNTGRWGGNPEFVRGELNDSKWANTPMAKLNQTLNYYWTSISSVDRGLDAWECKVLDENYKEAYAFSHRYSFYKKAETSPVAFIVLRDVLDYSDQSRFPENEYGGASRTNQNRINNILATYESYGAQNDDNEAVKTLNQADYLLNVTGYNDCTWNVIARNYRRFITQVEPNETSSGYWRVGITQEQPYGRFARGFDVEKNKNAMYFDVDDQYAASNSFKVKIIYYANDGGSWELKYRAKDGTMKTACSVNNEPGKNWFTKEVLIEDALLDNGGPKGADLILQNTGNTNCRFHLIELNKNRF